MGEEINTISSGTFVQKQYVWQLPSDINGINLDPSKLSVVAFVSESAREVISGNEKKVSSAGWIAPSWDCTGGACVDPGTGNGFYSSEQQCIDNCNITPTWNCTYSGPNQGVHVLIQVMGLETIRIQFHVNNHVLKKLTTVLDQVLHV